MDSATHALTPQDGPLRYLVYAPKTPTLAPPLVLVHGNNRSPSRLFRDFLPLATKFGIPLIAPRFTKEQFPRYQQLAGSTDSLGAKTALDVTLDHAASTLGLSTDLVDLVGFSGGAQFAHRYAMVAPARVVHLVPVAAGWYTLLDASRPFPRGTATSDPTSPIFQGRFLEIPTHVIVGANDTSSEGSLRTARWLTRTQGVHRLERAERWVEHVRAAADSAGVSSRIELEVVSDVGHSLTEMLGEGRLAARVFEFVHPGGSLQRVDSSTMTASPPLGGS